MKRTENGVNLSNQEADAVIEVLDNATELVDEMHKNMVEIGGGDEILVGSCDEDNNFRQAEAELKDSISTIKSILQDSTDDKLKDISEFTANTTVRKVIDAFVKIEE